MDQQGGHSVYVEMPLLTSTYSRPSSVCALHFETISGELRNFISSAVISLSLPLSFARQINTKMRFNNVNVQRNLASFRNSLMSCMYAGKKRIGRCNGNSECCVPRSGAKIAIGTLHHHGRFRCIDKAIAFLQITLNATRPPNMNFEAFWAETFACYRTVCLVGS